ncbi:DUF1343 domain-containing protein [Atribacter laminatus]|uniref:DUF1343 domain-containing protein n=1 Tax=Atribacter laminatus TaxID=2847778 RepID=A0A7T1ALE9_ATRLM|nr:DUF1343 domain-containing protein [Atribacter laminatus]QPM68090.1 hypothetical protein RT761_01304 [Atribacter laminatus]
MKKIIKFISFIGIFIILLNILSSHIYDENIKIKLGNEVLFEKHFDLIKGKRIGLITNQTGLNSRFESTVDLLANNNQTNLVALFAPEHGLDGKTKAGEYVESYLHDQFKIPVYSLYGPTRKPTPKMLENVDLLLFDIQDIGARTYTYISTLNYCMWAAKENGKTVVVLDRPNPLGGLIVDGPISEEDFLTFVGVDILPMAHGMTIGEIARYFNRLIGVKLIVVPMDGYFRDMMFPDTGLYWIPTSPMIPDFLSALLYMATGLGEGTGIRQGDYFKWVGGKGIDSRIFAQELKQIGLPGVHFVPETKGEFGGVRLSITDMRTFQPVSTGLCILSCSHKLISYPVPKSVNELTMFDKIMGTGLIGQLIENDVSCQDIKKDYQESLEIFKRVREKYLIYK